MTETLYAPSNHGMTPERARIFAEQGFREFGGDIRSVRAPVFLMSVVCIARAGAARS